jgi:hypothetical protein
VLRQNAHTYNTRRNFLNSRNVDNRFELPRRHRRSGIAKNGLQRLVRVHLQELSDHGRKFTTALDSGQHGFGHAAFTQRVGKQIRGGDRVLNGEIDADAADRRHSVRGIADAQESRPVPLAQTGLICTESSLI